MEGEQFSEKKTLFVFAASFICFAVEGPQNQLFVEEFLHLSIDNFQSKQQVFFGGVILFEEKNYYKREKCLGF